MDQFCDLENDQSVQEEEDVPYGSRYLFDNSAADIEEGDSILNVNVKAKFRTRTISVLGISAKVRDYYPSFCMSYSLLMVIDIVDRLS